MPTSEHPETTAARRLRELRNQRGLTLKGLADRCAAIGAADLTVHAIQAAETFRRRIYLNDVVALACALNVSPFEIFMPTTDIKVKVAWNVEAFAEETLSWWLGRRPRPGIEPDDDAMLAARLQFRQHLPYAAQHSRVQLEAGNITALADEVRKPKDGQ